MSSNATVEQLVLDRFRESGLDPVHVEVKSFPGETIVVVEVDQQHDRAMEIARELDGQIESGFVTIRQAPSAKGMKRREPVFTVHDERVPKLIELMSARARTSEAQPSLRYVEDASERRALAISPRHHLVFGRRGVGKTALLLEARKQLERSGALTLWVNMHTLRDFDKQEAFVTISLRLCDLAMGALRGEAPEVSSRIGAIRASLADAQADSGQKRPRVSVFIPQLQHAIGLLCGATEKPLYIFLDDIHYMASGEVPGLLDFLHGISRDNPVWLKVAGIRHQTRWFTPDPPTGLQTGQDASIINLDITLEQPSRAKRFLRNVLLSYIEESDTEPLRSFVSAAALDRLVLASGGVPRDFLLLCVGALQIARQRRNAKTMGVQDVNHAAGAAAQAKLQELEDDAAAARGRSRDLVFALDKVKSFLLDEKQFTFLLIDFLDKEKKQQEYGLMQGLMDLRMLHLINSSISDDHHAGRRSEVYMLDLSQYSGARLKRNLRVLDFVKDNLILKRTQGDEPSRVGDTPRKLVDLLRRGPNFNLSNLSEILNNAAD